MKVIIKSVWYWSGTQYVKESESSFEYTGPVALACGATNQQGQIATSQQNFAQQAQQQATSEFGSASTVFNQLMSTLSPTIAAGPSQQGFSQGELSNLNSQAITQTGQEYQNEKAATGNAMAASGGGTSALPSGATEGAQLSLAENAGNQTANELGQIKQADYQQGLQNYNTALSGMEAAPGVFGTSTGATGAATGAGSAAATSANNIAQEQQSWIAPVAGALGGIAGAAAGFSGGGVGSNPPMLDTSGASTLAPQVGGYNFPTTSPLATNVTPTF